MNMNKTLLISSLFFILLSGLLTIVFSSTLYLMMGWNMLLAVISLFLIFLFNKSTNRYLKIIILLLWILFFPNTFYLITDLIHIARFNFFEQANYSSYFVKNIEGYIFIIFILFGTVISLRIGLESLNEYIIYNIENKILKISNFIIVLCISLLSSIGIFIGRFLRFNSWDILSPLNLMSKVIKEIDSFAIAFILLFTIVHLVIICYDQYKRGVVWKK
ncbi:hypothetical protein CI105_02585 [Candidatus Izimaplasma bacterium ZiA1]|uniref:DUF1361 domain-containing protein n=1 Tax=Candidatus Izimoplasma sp. ZiA1 TaxID=2024899 RepID=UPI000BAA6D51|nr:hypothetical protein CI105_02585 [Candidatus Izimaplasma bacterium ZiA1]